MYTTFLLTKGASDADVPDTPVVVSDTGVSDSPAAFMMGFPSGILKELLLILLLPSEVDKLSSFTIAFIEPMYSNKSNITDLFNHAIRSYQYHLTDI